jgi:hypothetical protein
MKIPKRLQQQGPVSKRTKDVSNYENGAKEQQYYSQ